MIVLCWFCTSDCKCKSQRWQKLLVVTCKITGVLIWHFCWLLSHKIIRSMTPGNWFEHEPNPSCWASCILIPSSLGLNTLCTECILPETNKSELAVCAPGLVATPGLAVTPDRLWQLLTVRGDNRKLSSLLAAIIGKRIFLEGLSFDDERKKGGFEISIMSLEMIIIGLMMRHSHVMEMNGLVSLFFACLLAILTRTITFTTKQFLV